MAHQHGLVNCVAVLGTALGERHLQLLRRYTDSITLILDGDEAGRRRTNEILDNLLALFEKNQVDLRILTLPEGADPCDFIAQHGSEKFRELLAEAVDALEHKFKTVTQGLDTLTDTHRASQAAEQMLATLAAIRPSSGGASSQALLREEQMLSRVARKFHLPEEKLRSRLTALRRESRSRQAKSRGAATNSAPTIKTVKLDDLPASDRLLLELLLVQCGSSARIRAAVNVNLIETEVTRRIYDTWLNLTNNIADLDVSRFVAEFDDPDIKSLLVGLDLECVSKAPVETEQMLRDLLAAYARRETELQRRSALAAAQRNSEEADHLLAQFCEQSKSKHLSDYERRKK
jgi:DNA primase